MSDDGQNIDDLLASIARIMPDGIVIIEIDDDGPIDPLAAIIALTALGINPLEVAEVLELFTICASPLFLAENITPGYGPYGASDEFNQDDVYRTAESLGLDIRPEGTHRVVAELNALDRGIPPIFPFALPLIGTDHGSISSIADMTDDHSRGMFDELAERRRRQTDNRSGAMSIGDLNRRPTTPKRLNRAGSTPLDPASAHYLHDMVRRSVLFIQLISMGMTPDVDVDPDPYADAESAADMVRALTEARRRAAKHFDEDFPRG